MPARTVEIAFLGNTRDLEAALERAGLTADTAGKKIGDKFTEGTNKAAGGLSKLSSLGAAWGIPFMGSLDKIGEKLDQAGSKTAKFSTALQEAGKVTLLAGTAGFAGAAAEAVKLGEKFQTATTSIQTNAGITQKAAQNIGSAFLDTAGKSTFSGQQMASAYAAVAGQLRLTEGAALSTAQATKVMAAASDLAEASQTDLGTATQALAGVMQAYHLGVNQAAGASNILFNASKATGVGVQALGQAADRLHGRLGVLAPSLQDVTALMVEMAEHGVTGSRGVMQVNSALQTLVGGSKKVDDVLKALGITLFNQRGQFVGLQSVISQMQPKLAGLTGQQQLYVAQTVFGKNAGQAMLGIMQSGVSAYNQATAAVTKQNAVQAAAQAQSHTLHGEMETLKATVQDLGTKFGLFLIPKLQELGQWLASGITWLEKHKAAAIALGAAIAGPLALAVMAFIAGQAAGFIGAIGKMGAGFVGLGTKALTAAGVIKAADTEIVASADTTAAGVDTAIGSTGIGLILIGLSVAATELMTHWQTVMNTMKSAVQDMVSGAEIALNGLISALNAAIGVFNSTIGQLTGQISTIPGVGVGGGGSSLNFGPSPVPGHPGIGTTNQSGFMSTPLSGTGATGPGGVWTGANGQVTQASFAASLLSQLGLPTNSASIRDVTAWMAQEGGNWANNAKYNPLNTTMGETGASSINSVGVKSYTSWAQGLAATVATLKQSNMAGILAALKAGASPSAFSAAVAASPWGTGAVSAQGQTLGNSAIQALVNQGAKGPAAKKVTYGPSQNVLNMLQMAQELSGTPYTQAGHASAYNETVAQIKKFGTDCSGLVSVLLKEGVSGIRAAQTTQGLPTAAGLAPGAGKYITVYDRHTGPVADEHTFIEILGHYFEEGGVLRDHAGEMTKAQVAQELAGGGFEAFHPTASYLNQAVAGAKSSSFSSAAAGASIQTAIDNFIAALNKAANALVQTYQSLEQSGTVKTLEKALGVSTGGSLPTTTTYSGPTITGGGVGAAGLAGLGVVTGAQTVTSALYNAIEGISTSKVQAALGSGQNPTQLDKTLIPILEKASANSQATKNFNTLVAELRASGQKGEANALVSARGGVFATLAQEMYAQQITKDAESIQLQATQEKDQTQLAADTAAKQLQIVKDTSQQQVDQITEMATQVKDQTQIITDTFQQIATQISDATQAMADSANAAVQGINDQTQTQVDILGERGLYGLNLIAQQQTVQLDQMKATYDQQIAAAQAQLDATKATWDAAVSNAQLSLDQVQLGEDAKVALSQQHMDTVQLGQDTKVASAQAHVDSVTLANDVAVQLAQTAVDLSANAPKAQQDIANAQLKKATATENQKVGAAQGNLSAVTSAATAAITAASDSFNQAQATATEMIGSAQQTLASIQGQASIAINQAQQNLQGIQDTASIAEATQQGVVSVTQARASTQFAGSGLTVNMYGIPMDSATAIGTEMDWFARTALGALS